jgi:hypothetical protein
MYIPHPGGKVARNIQEKARAAEKVLLTNHTANDDGPRSPPSWAAFKSALPPPPPAIRQHAASLELLGITPAYCATLTLTEVRELLQSTKLGEVAQLHYAVKFYPGTDATDDAGGGESSAEPNPTAPSFRVWNMIKGGDDLKQVSTFFSKRPFRVPYNKHRHGSPALTLPRCPLWTQPKN